MRRRPTLGFWILLSALKCFLNSRCTCPSVADLRFQEGGHQLHSSGSTHKDGWRRRTSNKRTTPAWSDVGRECALDCLRRPYGNIRLPSLKDWAGDESDRPMLNSRNTQGSNHQLHPVLVPGRKLEIQCSAETHPRSHSSLEVAAAVRP